MVRICTPDLTAHVKIESDWVYVEVREWACDLILCALRCFLSKKNSCLLSRYFQPEGGPILAHVAHLSLDEFMGLDIDVELISFLQYVSKQ